MAKMSPVLPPPGTASRTPAVPLDAVDRQILEVLSADGRTSVRELAERVRIGRATAYNRLERLQATGVIRGFTVVLDPRRAGAGLAAYVYVKIDQHGWRTVGAVVAQMPGVEHVALVSGEFDLLVLVRVHDPSDLRDVVLEQLHAIDGVTATQTTFVLDELDGPGYLGTAG
ncbi:MAG TPA: Lrp/AsnC family transcriptional regulator [Acidimicrobiales bacterium]|jgi:DNA-binding Lrp family transcriptional regulator|nr:Lrp/AsnC family transcriptional regulator [Acidimicrobiales bacterium]